MSNISSHEKKDSRPTRLTLYLFAHKYAHVSGLSITSPRSGQLFKPALGHTWLFISRHRIQNLEERMPLVYVHNMRDRRDVGEEVGLGIYMFTRLSPSVWPFKFKSRDSNISGR